MSTDIKELEKRMHGAIGGSNGVHAACFAHAGVTGHDHFADAQRAEEIPVYPRLQAGLQPQRHLV